MELQERIKIVLLIARLESPIAALRAIKSENWPNPPSVVHIQRIYDKFCEFGTVLDRPRCGRGKISQEESTDIIVEILAENPKSTLAAISSATDLSRSTIQRRIKQDIRQKSYKIQTHQQLIDGDTDRRVEMAETLLPILQEPSNKNKIYFSDEAMFTVCGRVHKQNCRIWGYEKPTEVREEPLHSPKVNVWCAMSANEIIGPFFFEEPTVKSENYLNMLNDYLFPILKQKRGYKSIIFQQDGAPAHYSLEVRTWLNQKFPGKWIGRRGAIEWAPRSPDLTPLDFFLWGYLKQKVFKTPVKDLTELRQRITEQIQLIEPDTLKSVFLNIEKRLVLIQENNGAHIEQLL